MKFKIELELEFVKGWEGIDWYTKDQLKDLARQQVEKSLTREPHIKSCKVSKVETL